MVASGGGVTGFAKMGLILFLTNKVQITEETLPMMRYAYWATSAVMILMSYLVYRRVKAANDMTRIFVPPPATPFQPASADAPRTATTYFEHELGLAKQLIQENIIGFCITTGIHFKMEVNQVLVRNLYRTGRFGGVRAGLFLLCTCYKIFR
jgi:hypothetical protein